MFHRLYLAKFLRPMGATSLKRKNKELSLHGWTEIDARVQISLNLGVVFSLQRTGPGSRQYTKDVTFDPMLSSFKKYFTY